MPSAPTLLAFSAAAAALVLLPGPNLLYIISRGISKAGTRRGYGDAPFDRGGNGGGAPFQGGSGY